MSLKEFFGFGGYEREAEGYMSWQHLTFVSILMLIMIVQAIFWGRRNKSRSDEEKMKVILVSALLMDGVEIIKVVLICFRSIQFLFLSDNRPLWHCEALWSGCIVPVFAG